jgi:hypothetical protein
MAPLVLASSLFPPVGDQWGRRPLPLTGLAHPCVPKAGVRRGQKAPLERGIGFPLLLGEDKNLIFCRQLQCARYFFDEYGPSQKLISKLTPLQN